MATTSNFDLALSQVADEDEGDYYDGKGSHDPNPTMRGVTQRTYNDYRTRRGLPHREVRDIESHELRDIYLTYWRAVKGDLFGLATATALLDHAVNAGPARAIRLLQKATGAAMDGFLGPKTLQAASRLEDNALALRLSLLRLQYYADLARDKKHRPSLLSWVRRTLELALPALDRAVPIP